MRKITAQATKAFYNGVSFKSGNTGVKSISDGVWLFLHGNRIAYKNSEGQLFISSCGWETPTTKERLNGVLSCQSMNLYQKKGVWYITDYPQSTNKDILFFDNMEVNL